MKVALVTDGIHPYVIGGMQKHSFCLAKYLAQREVNVDLYHLTSTRQDASSLDIFTPEEKKFIRSFVFDFPREDSFPGHYLRASYRHSSEVYDSLKHHLDVDFIYFKGFTGWKFFEEKKQGLQSPPTGVNFHGMNMFQKAPSFAGWLGFLAFRGPVRFSMNAADWVFSYGGKISEIITSTGVPGAKILELPGGVEESWLSPVPPVSGSDRRFLFIGRYEPLKGIKVLNRALEKVLKKFPFEVTIVGPIPESKRIIHPEVKYAGVITEPAELKNLIDRNDVLLCPSWSEGMPNVILEAMARGNAVIATDVGAVGELVNSTNGWLISPGDDEMLASSIEQAILMGNPELQRKKKSSLDTIRRGFLWNNIIDRFIEKIGVIAP